MSWIEKIQSDLIIQTGDGKKFKPLWMNATKELSFNVAEFEFPEVEGTLVKKSKVMGRKYNLELYFQGADHLTIAEDFENSSKDPRPWQMIHPFYGSIRVQPSSFLFDNSDLNVTKIVGVVTETILDEYPKGQESPIDKIANDAEVCNETFANKYAAEVSPEARDVSYMKAYTEKFSSISKQIIKGSEMVNEYSNSFNIALGAINTATSGPLMAMRSIQNTIKAPARFENNVKERFDTLRSEFDSLRSLVSVSATRSEKYFYQTSGATALSAMAVALSTPKAGDFVIRETVSDFAQKFLDAYNTFVSDLDLMQSDNGGIANGFTPDFESMHNLISLVNYTLSNLFNIASEAKQERIVILEKDSNWVLLAHRFYGLQADDSTIQTLIDQNGLGLDSILIVRKNTQVKYFI